MNRVVIVGAILLFLSGLLIGMSNLVAASPEWQSKVDSELLAMPRSTTAPFLVILREQPSLNTNGMSGKNAKAAHVFETLSVAAAESQPPVLAVLERQNAPYRSYWIINIVSTQGDLALIESLALLDSVERISTNPTVQNLLPVDEVAIESGGDPVLTWGLEKTGVYSVWTTLGVDGSGVTIAGQDTGYVWTHETLQPRYRGWNGTTADHNYNWHDAIHELVGGGTNICGLDSPEPCDDFNSAHGTHTMGTMVGGDESGTSIGMAPGAKWIGCRDMERGNGTLTSYIECYEWFVAPTNLNGENPDPTKSPHVINNSWSCPTGEGCNTTNFDVMRQVVDNVRAAGILSVHSAGNSGNSCGQVKTPGAIYDNSFTVGSTTSTGAFSSFSAFGPVTVDGSNRPKPDIVAPGSGVYSARRTGYGNSSGTSMAAPHVAGLAALIISAEPAFDGEPDAIEEVIQMTATPMELIVLCGSDSATDIPNNNGGYGEINAYAAVQMAIDNPPLAVDLSELSTASSTHLLPALLLTLLLTATILFRKSQTR